MTVVYGKAKVNKQVVLTRGLTDSVAEGILSFDSESEMETVMKLLVQDETTEIEYSVLLLGRKVHLMRPFIGDPSCITSIASGSSREHIEEVLAKLLMRKVAKRA